jgi:hypothetical protein
VGYEDATQLAVLRILGVGGPKLAGGVLGYCDGLYLHSDKMVPRHVRSGRFRVWLYNDLRVEPLDMLRDVFEILEVDDTSRTERIF